MRFLANNSRLVSAVQAGKVLLLIWHRLLATGALHVVAWARGCTTNCTEAVEKVSGIRLRQQGGAQQRCL